ncbi:MAG: GAF domain-containing sensor histidine kinase [Chloroflexota bacterium]
MPPSPSAQRLPVPPLIQALVAWQQDATPAHLAATGEALGALARSMGLTGITLHAGCPPLNPIDVSWGEPSGEPIQLLDRSDGQPIGQLTWAGETDPRIVIEAVAMALTAVRAQERARLSEARLAALDAAVRGITGVLDVDVVLQLIVDRVRELADADYAALGIVDATGAIEHFVTSGISDKLRRKLSKPPRGHGMLGLIIRENRSIRVPDIGADERRHGFPPDHPEMHSFLGVPISVRGSSVGNLYLTNKRGAPEFSADDQRLVEMFALHAGIAIDNARLHAAQARLVVVDERDRIGRDLHDGIIQSIYAVTLSLDDVPELVREDPDEAAQRVDAAIDSLHRATADIRNFIFGLRPLLLGDADLVEALQAAAEEVRRNTGLAVSFDTTVAPDLPAESMIELLAIGREAMSNIARHAAGATSVRVSLAAQRGALVLDVRDDGDGFDPLAARGPQHQGLPNMRSRAERLGGTFEVSSTIGSGTRIIVRVPLAGAGINRGDRS